MAQVTVPSELDLLTSTEDPSDPGDIRIIRTNPLVISNCDSTTGWASVNSTFARSFFWVHEGSYSLQVVVDSASTGSLTYTGAAQDLSGYKYIKGWIFPYHPIKDAHMFMGEASSTEQLSGSYTPTHYDWTELIWDISTIDAADRDGITKVGIYCSNTSAGTCPFYFDYLTADAGPSEIKGYDGDRIIKLYPKVLHGLFTGDGTTAHTIFLSNTSDATVASRKGTPINIKVLPSTGTNVIEWIPEHNTTGGEWSYKHHSTGHEVTNFGITQVGDGFFVIASCSGTNVNNRLYSFTALYED